MALANHFNLDINTIGSGWSFRLKKEGKVKEKILRKLTAIRSKKGRDAGNVTEISSSIQDIVRYTIILPSKYYFEGVTMSLQSLDNDYEYNVKRWKNYWKRKDCSSKRNDIETCDPYEGITNIYHGAQGNWKFVEDGGNDKDKDGIVDTVSFELQFHTTESFAAKDPSHAIYEKARMMSGNNKETIAKRDQLMDQSRAIWLKVPMPPQVEKLGENTKLQNLNCKDLKTGKAIDCIPARPWKGDGTPCSGEDVERADAKEDEERQHKENKERMHQELLLEMNKETKFQRQLDRSENSKLDVSVDDYLQRCETKDQVRLKAHFSVQMVSSRHLKIWSESGRKVLHDNLINIGIPINNIENILMSDI